MTFSEITGVVLAGGLSRRFGTDKASALLEGEPFLQWVMRALEPACTALVVVKAPGQVLPDVASLLPTTIVVDDVPHLGPLAGLLSALEHLRTDWAFVGSCDGPLLQTGLVGLLRAHAKQGATVVCPRIGGRLQPLTALYHHRSLPQLKAAFDAGERRLTAAVEGLNPEIVDETDITGVDPYLLSFHNVNSTADLNRLRDLLRSRDA